MAFEMQSWMLTDEEDAAINQVASTEGWCLMTDGLGDENYRIERDDEGATFADDEAAMDFVWGKAKTGSRIHSQALVAHLLAEMNAEA